MPLAIHPEEISDLYGNDPVAFRLAKNRFIIHLARLVVTPGGTMDDLGKQLNIPRPTLVGLYSPFHGVISPAQAVKIHELVKSSNQAKIDVLPLNYIRPDIFKS